jgi:hypothetical protein
MVSQGIGQSHARAQEQRACKDTRARTHAEMQACTPFMHTHTHRVVEHARCHKRTCGVRTVLSKNARTFWTVVLRIAEGTFCVVLAASKTMPVSASFTIPGSGLLFLAARTFGTVGTVCVVLAATPTVSVSAPSTIPGSGVPFLAPFPPYKVPLPQFQLVCELHRRCPSKSEPTGMKLERRAPHDVKRCANGTMCLAWRGAGFPFWCHGPQSYPENPCHRCDLLCFRPSVTLGPQLEIAYGVRTGCTRHGTAGGGGLRLACGASRFALHGAGPGRTGSAQ